MRSPLFCWFFLVGLAGCLPVVSYGQVLSSYNVVYRPPSARYYVFKSPRFDIIYEQGLEQEAREAAALLEQTLAGTKALVGTRRPLWMPVVLNGFNDRSNGFVRTHPFKQEIEAISLKGDVLSRRFPNWLWAVTPHELTHAVQANAGRGFGVGMFMRWFAPDLMRSLNLTMPAGLIEGAAVNRESHVHPRAGRLNHSLFQMRFRAAMLSKRPWSLVQMLEIPAYSRPFDSFYLGGSHFFRYFSEVDSARFFHRLVNFHYRVPLFGHGVELWYGTGRWPGSLGRRFRRAVWEEEAERLGELGPLSVPRVVAQGPGRHHRRPRWLNDSTLVAYVTGYDIRTGFYRYDARTGRRALIRHQRLTEDDYYSLTKDRSALLHARYVPDPFVIIKSIADVFRVEVATGRVRALTTKARVVAPVEVGTAVWALQNDGQYNQIVQIAPSGRVVPLTAYKRADFVQIAPSPEGDVVAVLLNVLGRQGLFQASLDEAGGLSLTPWLLFEDASIYDVDWGPEGRYLLFSADLGGVVNAYAYDREQDRLLKLTNVPFGVREPSLSPDGSTLAFAHYQHEQYHLVTMPFRPEEAPLIPRTLATAGEGHAWVQELREETPTPHAETVPKPYRAWPYMAPRAVYPTLRYDDGGVTAQDTELGLGLGLAVQGADPLQRWVYGAETFFQDGRPWGQATFQSGRYVVQPFLSFFDLPTTSRVLLVDSLGQGVGTLRVGRERRGAAAGVRLPLILGNNVYETTASLFLRADYRQERLFDRQGRTLRPFRDRVTLTPAAALGYRLQSNRRDLIPNSGLILQASASLDVWREALQRRRALLAQLSGFVPVSLRTHTGLRLQAGLLTQNIGDIFNTDRFLPRGYEDEFLPGGSFVRLGAEVVQPLWFIENGFILLPFYFKALYLYGFAETVFPVEGTARKDQFSALGGGLGLQLRFFYRVDLDLRFGVSYLLEERRWTETFR